MSDAQEPHEKHSDDAVADDGAPTDAATDEVREDSSGLQSPTGKDFPDIPAATHP